MKLVFVVLASLCAFLSVLVHSEDLTLGFIRLNNLPAVHTVEIKNGQEYILCFNSQCYSWGAGGVFEEYIHSQCMLAAVF